MRKPGKKCVVCGEQVEATGALLCKTDRWLWHISFEYGARKLGLIPPAVSFRHFIAAAKRVKASPYRPLK